MRTRLKTCHKVVYLEGNVGDAVLVGAVGILAQHRAEQQRGEELHVAFGAEDAHAARADANLTYVCKVVGLLEVVVRLVALVGLLVVVVRLVVLSLCLLVGVRTVLIRVCGSRVCGSLAHPCKI